MSQSSNGYILGLIKDPKLNPFFLLRDITNHTIYNITTLGMPGRILFDVSRTMYRKVLTASVESFTDYTNIMKSMVSHNVSDSYIVIDKFDMIADLARKNFSEQKEDWYRDLSRFEFDHYRDVLGPLLKLDNRIILVTKPCIRYNPDLTKRPGVSLSGLRRTEYWCHDISYFMNTDPCTLLMHYHGPSEQQIFMHEPTIQQIEGVLLNESTNETTAN